MRRALVFLLVCLPALSYAISQHVDWDMQGAHEAMSPLQTLPSRDSHAISHRLIEKPSNLRVTRIDTASGHLFVVQGMGNNLCGGTGNCKTWVMSGDYKVLMIAIAQTFKFQERVHHGQPDLLTSMHGSAYDGDLKRWRFNGTTYRLIACAEHSHADARGNQLERATITTRPCFRK
ncbi:MAG: hypothetical protein ABI147_06840 [Acidobacteriaceae bacterium]